jgi:hypothetical protein
MADGMPNKPRILRGAFVEFGLSLPPLFVVFQFNPLQLTRSHALTFAFPGVPTDDAGGPMHERTTRQRRGDVANLLDLQKQQLVTVADHTIAFEIRLNATDRLDDGNAIAEQFGIAPALSTLELMVYPKDESLLGKLFSTGSTAFSFTRGENPPMILFIFGRKRVLPVNINTMTITETEFSSDLNPVRATVAVNLTVIEGKSIPYLYSKAMTEVMSVLNLADAGSAVDVVVPG